MSQIENEMVSTTSSSIKKFDNEQTPQHCPGTSSSLAGKTNACEGCPNQQICSTSKPNEEDLDIPIIKQRLKNIKHIILILSGKGGVGKSFVSTNLSLLLSKDEELQVGLLDVDICGPSIPKLLNIEEETVHNSVNGLTPIYYKENLAVMSIGFLLNNKEEAIIWRGNKKTGLIKQFLKDVDFDQLDYLIIDTPPGTSDEHLSIVKFIKEATRIDGAILVTTPQEVALQDVAKELDFCRKFDIKIIGLVENMSSFVCPKCLNKSDIFKATTGGAQRLAKEWNTKVIAKIPLSKAALECSDNGTEVNDETILKEIEKIVKVIVNET